MCSADGTFYQNYGLKSIISYPIDPQVNPAKRYPLSDIERAVGAPSPVVSSFVGMLDYLLLYLKSPLHVEK